MRIKFILFVLLIPFWCFAQNVATDFDAPDSLYREDQFYIGIAYASFLNQPDGFTQNKFSPSITLGLLRDMPVNKKRTLAVAAGIGYSLTLYNHNVTITRDGDTNQYGIIGDAVFFTKNRQTIHTLDVPIEFRWRNSTPESHKFWRIYTGFKMSYIFSDRYSFVSDEGNVTLTNNPDLNRFLFGTYLSVGWNTVNLYAYYSLNPLFQSRAKIDDREVGMNGLHFGLQFYIL